MRRLCGLFPSSSSFSSQIVRLLLLLNNRGRSEGRDPVQCSRSDRGMCKQYSHSRNSHAADRHSLEGCIEWWVNRVAVMNSGRKRAADKDECSGCAAEVNAAI